MMTTVTIKLEGTDLSSRKAAANQYRKITKEISCGNKVIIDLSDVLSISHSYADELFGVFAEVYGITKIIDDFQFHAANKHVLKSIASAIHERNTLSDHAQSA